MQVSFEKRELNAKVVLWGPPGGGKSSILAALRRSLPCPSEERPALTAVASEADPERRFEHLRLDLGTIDGFRTRVHFYVVPAVAPGDPLVSSVIRNADGVLFVSDASAAARKEARRALAALDAELRLAGLPLDLPRVLQWTGCEATDALPRTELERTLNQGGAPSFTADLCTGAGMVTACKEVIRLVLEGFARDYGFAAHRRAPRPQRPRPGARTSSARLARLEAEAPAEPTPRQSGFAVTGVKKKGLTRRLLRGLLG